MFGFIRKWREKRARDKARRKGLGSMNSGPIPVSWGKPPRHGSSSAATVYTAPMYYPEAIQGDSGHTCSGSSYDGGSSSSDSGCSGSSGGSSD